MRTRALAALALIAACSSKKHHDESKPVQRDAAVVVVTVDWAACDAAIKQAASAPDYARIGTLIAGCQVCGDWKPLLEWNKPHEDGGPTRQAIQDRMQACDAFCDPSTKQRFLGTLDAARGSPSRAPWRLLGEGCRDKLSAVPDPRYMSAPYLALDRIGRKVSEHGGDSATALPAIELTLPAITFTSIGVQLPSPKAQALKTVPAIAITVLGDQLLVGKIPRAHLGKDGVTVDLGTPLYPGTVTATKDLGAAIAKVGDVSGGIALLAPTATLAHKLADVIAAAPADAQFALAVIAPDSPIGWAIPAALPITLTKSVGKGAPVVDADHSGSDAVAADGGVTVTVSDTTTNEQLADTLDALAGKHVTKAAIVRAPSGTKR